MSDSDPVHFCGVRNLARGPGDDCFWHKNDLLYYLAAAPPPLSMDEWRGVYREATRAWCRSGRLRIRETRDRKAADWEALVYEIDRPNGTLAHSIVPCGIAPNWVLPVNMAFDSHENWRRDGNLDFALAVAAHEIGHMLGLWHRDQADDSVMRPGWTPQNAKLPTAADLAAIDKVYPKAAPPLDDDPAPAPPELAYPPPHGADRLDIVWNTAERLRQALAKRGYSMSLTFDGYGTLRQQAQAVADHTFTPWLLYPSGLQVGSPVVLVSSTPEEAAEHLATTPHYAAMLRQRKPRLAAACVVVPVGAFPGPDGHSRYWAVQFA